MSISTTKPGVFLSLVAMLLLASGCVVVGGFTGITGSGNLVTRQYALTNFSGLDAGSAFQVELSCGDKCSVRVTADDNLVEHLEVFISGSRLHLGLKPNVNVRDATLKAVVTMPALASLRLSGATGTTISGFHSAQPLDLNISGASNLRGQIRTGDARLEVSGASGVDLQGSAANLVCRTFGASHADLDHFRCKDATVESSGASRATIQASGNLDLEASGASSVRYVGQPAEVKARTSGASSIRPG